VELLLVQVLGFPRREESAIISAMNDNKATDKTIRPTRQQKALLDFITVFISENGYSPSYREIKTGMSYGSVGTVAVHVNNLINRGHLVKRGTKAHSIELVNPPESHKLSTNLVEPSEEKWLVEKIEYKFKQVEDQPTNITEASLANLQALIAALQVLGIEGAAQSFLPRLNVLKQHIVTTNS
jgi:SOS-response transcriptional repressor LexA